MVRFGTRPMAMQVSTSASIGMRIQRTGSWGSCGRSRAGGPKKVWRMNRRE